MRNTIKVELELGNQGLSPLTIATIIAMPWTEFNDQKITLHIPTTCWDALKNLLHKVENKVAKILRNKEWEYIQLVVLEVILNKILWPLQLQFSSWSSDITHKFDATLHFRCRHYNIDMTLDYHRFLGKLVDKTKSNKSDWVVLLAAPGKSKFYDYILNWYSGDYSHQSLIDFLENNTKRLYSIEFDIRDRRTGEIPVILQNVSANANPF